MKINNKKFVEFMEKVIMTGPEEISEGVLNFDEQGMKISANTSAQTARVMAILKKTAFVEYSPIGKIALNELKQFKEVFKKFNDVTPFKKDNNVLVIGEGPKKVDVELMSENLMATDSAEPQLEFKESFVITGDKLNDIISDVQINKDVALNITTTEKKVIFKNDGKFKFTQEVEALTCKGGVDVTFGSPLFNCVAKLKGNLQVSVGSDYPCKIIETTEDSIITLIVAPRGTTE